MLPFCYFAYEKSVTGLLFTVVAVLTSMFWFPAPSDADPHAAQFLATEQQYVTGGWTWTKTAMTLLVPIWFVLLAGAFWRRSWTVGILVINVGAALKVVWSFYFGGGSAWSIVPQSTRHTSVYVACGYQERGRVSYKGNPLVYYELLLS